MKIKISDYFSHYNGKGSFKKMVEEGGASKTKTDKFKYPVYDASTKNNHIKGYADNFTHEGKFIKMNKGGEAGLSILIEGKVYAAGGSILLKSDKIDLTELTNQ